MKKLFSTALTFVVISFFFSTFNSCVRCNEESNTVDIYLLKSFNTVGITQEIDINSVVTKSEPFVKYSEIVSYNKRKYEFELTPSAIKNIANEKFPTNGKGFAIKANDKVIYAGYFWPSYSSASCDWFTIDPLIIIDNKITIKLGYPSDSFSVVTDDKRNDPEILDIFKSDNKLID